MYLKSDTHFKNLDNEDLLQEVRNELNIADMIAEQLPFRTPLRPCPSEVYKSPRQSALEALAKAQDIKMQKLGAPAFTHDDYIYKTVFPEIQDPHKFEYLEEGTEEYQAWQVWQSKFGKTPARDSSKLIEEMKNTSAKLKEELEARKNKQTEPCKPCPAYGEVCEDVCDYGRVHDDKVIRYYNSELLIPLFELTRVKETGMLDVKKLLDIETFFFLDLQGQQTRTLNLPGYGILEVDLVNLGIKYTPYSNAKGNFPAVKYEARNYDTRQLVTGTLSYNNRTWPVTIDVVANDQDVNPDTVQLIDPRSNRLSLRFAVLGEGVWYVDNHNFVVFEPDPALKGNPTPVLYQAYTSNDEYAGTARIEIDFGDDYKEPKTPPVGEGGEGGEGPGV